MSSKAECDNTANGCQWTGELQLLEVHLTNCGFALLPCPNQCKDGDKIHELMRKDIENHKRKECPRRQYECPHCKESGEYKERTTTHLKVCPSKKIPCPNNGCTATIPRCKVSQHREKCSFELVTCKYTDIGCTEKVFRKNLEEHQNDNQQHLQLAIDTVNQMQITINNVEDRIVHLQLRSTKFKVTGFDRLKTCSEIFYSSPFYTSPEGYKMCIGVHANGISLAKGTNVSVYAHLMRGEHDDHLQWPFTGTVTIELLNQLEDGNHHSMQVKLSSKNIASQRVLNRE